MHTNSNTFITSNLSPSEHMFARWVFVIVAILSPSEQMFVHWVFVIAAILSPLAHH